MGEVIERESFTYAEPPPRASIAEERLHRKQRLAAGLRLFSKFGFDQGLAGHITARDPEHLDHFWVNPFAKHFSQIGVSDLLLVNHLGDVVAGEGQVNKAAFVIHSALHRARPEVAAAAHAHSTYGKAWSTLGRRLDPITQDSTAFYDDHALFEEFTGVVWDGGEGARIAAALGARKAVILRNHGLLTVGATVEAAVWWFIAMEDAARTQLLAESAGRPFLIDDATARLTFDIVGTPLSGVLNFQPLWDMIIAEQPDLLH
jgi:ribulose-5-phosphate 4-epimerase/fuculose-1-phosphate aldolase